MTSILEGLRTGAWRLVPVEPNDKMMLMGGFRFAGRVPNSEVFKEVRKGWDDMLSASPDATAALLAEIEGLRAEVSRLKWTALNRVSELHEYLMVEALAEIKSTVDGASDQPVRDIVYGLIAEIEALPDHRARATKDRPDV